MQKFLLEQGTEPHTETPQQFRAYVRDEVEKWAKSGEGLRRTGGVMGRVYVDLLGDLGLRK